MKKTTAIVLVCGLVAGLVISRWNPISALIDTALRRETYTTSGKAVLLRLQEEDTLEVASGTFQVPVVSCNSGPKAFNDRESFEKLVAACDGFADERAIVLVEVRIPAVIQLKDIDKDDVKITGKRIALKVPSPVLGQPTADAESGVVVVSQKENILTPGALPKDFDKEAAGAAKDAVGSVAEEAGLLKTGRDSATTIFEGLLRAFGFEDVDLTFSDPPRP